MCLDETASLFVQRRIPTGEFLFANVFQNLTRAVACTAHCVTAAAVKELRIYKSDFYLPVSRNISKYVMCLVRVVKQYFAVYRFLSPSYLCSR